MTHTDAPAPVLSLDVYLGGRDYRHVVFEGPDAATHLLSFVERRLDGSLEGRRDAWFLGEECDDALLTDDLLRVFFPTCEHGLQASLCAGPGHYPMDV